MAGLTTVAVALGMLAATSTGASTASTGLGAPPKADKYNGKAMTLDATVAGAAWKTSPVKAPAPVKGAHLTAPVFPAASSSQVDLPAAALRSDATAVGQGGQSSGLAMTQVPGTPVSVGLPAASASARSDAAGAAVSGGGAPAPAKVTLTVADHATAVAADVSGAVVSVARADGKTGAASVSVAVDYSGFATAFGGDFADRLKLVALPACVLTTPKVAACQVQTALKFTNDTATRKLTATVTLPAVPASAKTAAGDASGNSTANTSASSPTLVLAATSASSGSTGSFTATSLSASNSWGESGNTGDFTYSYPIATPPALGGAAPSVSLDYDSGSVDGKTAVENSQPSWIGDGWDYSPGYIERSYVPCSSAKPTAYPASGDSCFARDASGKLLPALTMSFGPHGGQLVHDDADTSFTHYKLPIDDGTQIDELTGAAVNGSTNGEYYRVRLPDGSTAYFGAGAFPTDAGGTGTGAADNSAWVEPVFDNPNNSACQNPTTASVTSCSTVWRWNLDYLIDSHGNVTRYLYSPEIGYYGHGTGNTSAKYDRGGVLTEIDYGWQTADVTAGHQPAAKVLFTTTNRCVDPAIDDVYSANNTTPPSTNGAGPSGCATASSGLTTAWMPDTPLDQNCPPTTCQVTSPTFWSTLRLSGITTQVAVGGVYKNVDHYDLFDQFHQLDTSLSPLWLAAIRRCAASTVGSNGVCPQAQNGKANQTSLPDVQFSAAQLPQRVPGVQVPPGASGLPSYLRERIGGIFDELGSTTTVGYDSPSGFAPLGCTAPPTTVADWHNTKLCFPEYWTPPGVTSGPITDWFQKYVVTSIQVADNTHAANAAAPVVKTSYSYDTAQGAAWHSNDSDLVTVPASRSYDQYRGFAVVTTTVGSPGDTSPQTQTVTRYLRGMDSDPDKADATAGSCPANSPDCPYVFVSDDLGGSTQDDNAFAGMPLETQTLTGAGGSVWSTTVTRPWKSDPQATHSRAPLPAMRSRQLGTAQTLTQEPLASGSQRVTQVLNYYDQTNGGRLFLTDALAPVLASGGPVPGDTTVELCTATGYATSSSKPWMLQAENSVETQQAPCNTTGGGPNYSGAPSVDTLPGADSGTVVSATQTYYDGGTTWPTSVTLGDVTRTDALSGAAGSAGTMVMQSTATFDSYGRPLTSGNAAGAITATAYYPTNTSSASMELPVKQVVQGPDPVTGTSSAAWTTTTLADPTRELPTDVTDPNGRLTHTDYDALGRISAVWSPDHTKAANPTSPSAKFSYTVNGWLPGGASTIPPSVTETDTLRSDNTYAASVTLLDSLGRTRQTQTVPTSNDAGRIVTDTTYDSAGRVNYISGPYYDSGSAPSSMLWVPASQSVIPRQTQTLYDGLGRTTDVITVANGNELWRTHTDYHGVDRTDVTPPSGGVRTSTVTDTRGDMTAQYTYHGADTTAYPWGAFTDPTKVDATTYGYDAAGNQTSITDAAGNQWTSTYDLLGRQTYGHDPDSGDTTFGYDTAGDLTDTTTAQLKADGKTPQSLHDTFDMLGRKTFEYDGTSTAGTLLAAWTYDTVPALPASAGSDNHTNLGLPAGSKRYTSSATQPYVSQITGYDAGGRALATAVTVPGIDNNGALAGTYTTTNHYTSLGQLYSTDLPTAGNPATGGLGPDTVTYGYNVNGLLVGSADNYADLLTDSAYSPYGEIQRRLLGDYPNELVADTVYDPATRRVSNTTVSQLAWSAPVDSTAYTYDPAGQITATADAQGTATGLSADDIAEVNSTTDAQCFSYDYAGRLSQAWTQLPGDSIAGAVFGAMTVPPSGNQSTINTYATPVPGGLGGCANPAAAGHIGGPAPYWETFTYDAVGNRQTLTEQNNAGATTAKHVYSYGTAGKQPHTLTQTVTTGTGAGTDGYLYDPAGNTTQRTVHGQPTQTLNWNAEGRLATDADGSGAAAAYVYDADGTQLIRRDATTATLYLGTTEIHLNLSDNQVTGDRYFDFSGGPTVVETGGNTPTLSYEGGNLQNTASTTIDAAPATPDKAVLARRDYTPFNTPRGTGTSATFGTFPDDHTFLGKTTDATTGLVDIGDREYDPTTGRFLSRDPVLQPDDPQAIGGYAYADDDPINKTDPTGQCWSWIQDACNAATATGGFLLRNANVVIPITVAGECAATVLLGCPEAIAVGGTLMAAATYYNAQDSGASAGQATNQAVLAGVLGGADLLPGARAQAPDDVAAPRAPAAAAAEGADEAPSPLPRMRSGVCASANSFTGDTPVLMADGSAKPISQVTVGDQVDNAVPGAPKGTPDQHHTVTAVHVTDTDTDYTTLTVKAGKSTGTVTGTSHHIFYSLTAHAWVPAGDLKPGDVLQTPDGGTATVVGVDNFTSIDRTYNLTIDGLHTYYVVAGDVVILVHNDDDICTPNPILPVKVWTPAPSDDPESADYQGPLPASAGIARGTDLEPGVYTFVVNLNGKLRAMEDEAMYAAEESAGHTSLGNRQPVLMAGKFTVGKGGIIIKFGNFSGHYTPENSPWYRRLEDVTRDAMADFGLPAPPRDAWKTYDYENHREY